MDAVVQDHDAATVHWVESATGGAVVGFERKTGGSSRSTNLVDVRLRDGSVERLVLRLDTGDGPFSNTKFTLAREAATYRALASTPVPVPEIIAVSDAGDAVLMRRAPGHDSDVIDDPVERHDVAEDYHRRLAELHAVDIDTLGLEGFVRPTTAAEQALAELDAWQEVFETRVERPEPIVAFAFEWLRQHLPDGGDDTVLCWGDVGQGNFLYEHGRVTALLDWELAHFGDPLDDLAFHTLRTYLLFDGRFCDLDWSLNRYAELSGRKIDAARLDHYQAQCLVRWMISALAALDNRAGADMAGSTFLFLTTTVRVWLADVLARLAGIDLEVTPALAPGPANDQSEVVDLLTGDLTQVVAPTLTDSAARLRASGMVMLLSHLATAERLAEPVAEAELAALRSLLGADTETVRAGHTELQARIRSGSRHVDDTTLIRYFAASAARTAQLWPFVASFAQKPVPLASL